jgi:hypothetical protein
MSSKFMGCPSIAHGAHHMGASRNRSITVELIITAALALSTAVAATAVSIGIARADVIGAMAHSDPPFAIVLLVAMMLGAIGTLSAVIAPRVG